MKEGGEWCLNKYIYTDHKTESIIFTTETEGILKADKSFEKDKGFKPSKYPHIGCQIIFKGGN